MSITRHATPRHVTPQGEIGDTFFILKEGRALVTQASKSGGRDKQLRRMEEYSCFGERALLTAEPRSANVIAETKVCVCEREREREKKKGRPAGVVRRCFSHHFLLWKLVE